MHVAFLEKKPRKWGDRKDGCWVRDVPGLNTIMMHLFPNRTDNEVYLHQEIDITDLLTYLNQKNGPDAPYKTTLFHCLVTILARVLNERPKLNRFVQGRRTYERDEITISFIAKRRFTDHSEESLMVYKAKGSDNLDAVSRRIVGDVHEMRERKQTVGLDDLLDKFGKLPRLLLMLIIRVLRWLDFWGKVPKALTEGDTNYSSILVSNLGSIKCPAVYHHLNNYGTNSIMITIGAMHRSPTVLPDGSIEVRDFVDIGATLDERIADGFYFARSLKLVQYICAHPELLDRPLEEDSGYVYQ
jgi:hypothetical protein